MDLPLLERDNNDPNARGAEGYTPLHIACYRARGVSDSDSSRSVAIVHSLLSHRSTDPNALDGNGISSILDRFMDDRRYSDLLSLFL